MFLCAGGLTHQEAYMATDIYGSTHTSVGRTDLGDYLYSGLLINQNGESNRSSMVETAISALSRGLNSLVLQFHGHCIVWAFFSLYHPPGSAVT